MALTKNPWEIGPTELIEFALERMHGDTDFDRRIAYLVLDVGVETLIKTFLTIDVSISRVETSPKERKIAASGNFPDLLEGLWEALPERMEKYDILHLKHYHNNRNTLYHEGNKVSAVREDNLNGYARIAVNLLDDLLGIDLSEKLIPPEPVKPKGESHIVDKVEVVLDSGRYRIERYSDQTIDILDLNKNQNTPALPKLREIISEKNLDVDLLNTAGNPKNTRQLGKQVIETLKPSAWHGWIGGEKLHRDNIVSALTNRLRDGHADEKNWVVVDYMRNLKHDWLIFTPTGQGYGNSPFNMNCWRTIEGNPIKS